MRLLSHPYSWPLNSVGLNCTSLLIRIYSRVSCIFDSELGIHVYGGPTEVICGFFTSQVVIVPNSCVVQGSAVYAF